MTIEELLQEMYGDELSDLFVGNRHNPADSRPKLIPLLNTSMAYAYAKWKCAYDSEMLAITENVNEYTLAATNVLQVTQLVNVYGLDVPQDEWQVLGSQIYFPYPENQTVEVIFKISHAKYTVAQDDSLVDLVLPEMLVPWLKAYTAHRYFASMKTESALVKAADFLAQAMLCENIFMQTNTTNEFTAPTNRKIESRGFA